MIDSLFNSGAMPVLERLVQFTGQRHRLLVHDIANLSTPNFQPQDLSVESFEQALGQAIDRRRQQTGGPSGPLAMQDTAQLHFDEQGLSVRPQAADRNILFHDRNNRNLEYLMENLARNAMTHNTALELLHSQFNLLETAVRERP